MSKRGTSRGRKLMCLAAVCALAALQAVADGTMASKETRRLEQGGVEIRAALGAAEAPENPAVAGKTARLELTLSETATGSELTGSRPLGWLARRADGAPAPDHEECVERIRRFSSGGLSSLADIDLNQFYVYALNEDNSITVLNPLVSFSRTKLLTIMTLPANPADWAELPSESVLFVSLPDRGSLVRIDTRTHRIRDEIQVGGRPKRLLADPAHGLVWIADEESGALLALDGVAGRVAKRVSLGGDDIVFGADPSREHVVAASSRGLVVLAPDTREPSIRAVLSRAPQSLAVSELAEAAFLAFDRDGVVSVLDLSSGQERERIGLKPGLRGIAATPDGRWVLVPNALEKTVSVLDATGGGLRRTIDVDEGPDRITFTADYAYVRCIDSAKVDLIPWRQLSGVDAVGVVSVPVGQYPPGADVAAFDGQSIQAVPTADGVVIGGHGERNVFFYREGMMAPMGAYQNSSRAPLALRVINASLREAGLGTFQAEFVPPLPGTYDLAMALESPRVTVCTSFAVGGEVAPAPLPRLSARVLAPDGPIVAGRAVQLRVRVTRPGAGDTVAANLKDVQVLVYRPPGSFQVRLDAREAADGEYVVALTFPDSGRFRVLPRSLGQGFDYGDLSAAELVVAPPSAGDSGEGGAR